MRKIRKRVHNRKGIAKKMQVENTHTLRTGTVLAGRYQIEGVIGQGGFGITYVAVNEKIEMKVAIKEFYCREYTQRNVNESNHIQITDMTGENFERAKKRFLQEAKTLSGFNNENAIVKILDYFEENDTAYIVMNYLYGTPLDQYLQKNGPLPWREVVEKFSPLMETLKRVHNRGVIHRDISPGNIMVLENGTLCLLDFGSAKDFFKENQETVTTVFTKQGYTPIEQYAENGKLGAWTDVYALMAVCYECMTGTHPPDSLQRAVFDEYETLREKSLEAPAELDAVLKKGLAVRAEERYSNMGEVLSAMDGILAPKKGRKLRLACMTGFVAMFSLIIACVCYFFYYREQIYFNYEETESFCLVRDEDTNVSDFEQGFNRIEERIKILAGDKPYIWEKNEKEFRGTLPLSCFGTEDTRKVIRDLIARPCKWTICDVEIDFNYIDRIGFKDAGKRELEILLSENTPDEMQKNLKELCKDRAVLSVDYGYRDFISLAGKMNSPLSFTWNLEEKWKDEKLRELFLHNISQDALKISLDVYTQIPAVWEKKSEAADYGKWQCEPEELDECTVTLKYGKSDYDEELTEGEIEDYIRGMKERLDIMEVPYALGKEKNQNQHVVLCVNQQDYNKDLFWLIMRNGDDFNIKDSWGIEGLSSYEVSQAGLEVDKSQDKNVIIHIPEDTSEDTIKEINQWVENVRENDRQPFYFMAKNIPILMGNFDTEQMKKGTFTFSSLCMENSKIAGENEKIVKLINIILKSKYGSDAGYEMLAYQFSGKKNLVAAEAEKEAKQYCFSIEGEKETIEKVRALHKEYKVKSYIDYEDGERKFDIRLSDEIYSESVLNTNIFVEQIYWIMSECNMEKGTPWGEILVGIDSRYKKDSYAAKMIFRHPTTFDDKKQKKPYSISAVAFEKDEAKWMKEIRSKMLSDKRFKGYEIEFTDYSEYFIY